jgi:hypothetical protein
MVGRLVEQEDVGTDEHRTGELELHLPATRERADGVLLLLLREADLEEGGGDRLARRLLLDEVGVWGDESACQQPNRLSWLPASRDAPLAMKSMMEEPVSSP